MPEHTEKRKRRKYTKFRRIVFWAVPCSQVPAPPFFRDDFFYFFRLRLKIRIATIRLVPRKWVVGKPRAIFDTGGRTHASAALWHIESVNKARHVFVAPDMDVLNKKVRSKGEQK